MDASDPTRPGKAAPLKLSAASCRWENLGSNDGATGGPTSLWSVVTKEEGSVQTLMNEDRCKN
jgi:hypothetical protein